MLLKQITEMARPKKLCPDCGMPTAGFHYWYKGRKHCISKGGKEVACPPGEKTAPLPDDEERMIKGSVRGLEREAGEEFDPDVMSAERVRGKKRQAGSMISRADIADIVADNEEEAIEQIEGLFPNASMEQKVRAFHVWKALNRV